jgi:hypothetical protein
LACDNGVRKNPSDDRGPKLIMEIRQPQMITTMGVRQPTPAADFATAPCNVIVGISPAELIGPDPIEPVGLAKTNYRDPSHLRRAWLKRNRY